MSKSTTQLNGTTESSDLDAVISRFEAIGLDPKKARETSKNKKLSTILDEIIKEVGLESFTVSGTDKAGVLLYLLASKSPERHRGYIARRIVSGDLKNEAQIQAAINYAKGNESVNETEFDKACGVGVKVTREQVENSVKDLFEKLKESLLAADPKNRFNTMMREAKSVSSLLWAEGLHIKEAVENAIASLPSTSEHVQVKRETNTDSPSTRTFAGDVMRLHKPGENPQLSPEIMAKHLVATGGKVVTRFPPEPNGYPHIGHAKAMNFSFRYAEAHGGICYLRFDDTNPEAEETRYYEALEEAVRWLGFKPDYVTAASDYFQQLYEYAVELIRKGKAYVCHMTPEQIFESRGGANNMGPRYDSPWRDRSVEENLAEFEKMKRGEYKEGEATLRLKQDMQSLNPYMLDLVAYRILYHPHCRTGTQWCIYPMYDYTHCICDSIENITHSLCTTEFTKAREAYYWVVDNLGIYKAVQWEYGRLNITHVITSKRKILKLVNEKHVGGWDDPRLYTVAGLRRRGFTPAAINRFVEDVGITTSPTTVDVKKLEAFVRDDLNRVCMRRMAVLDPLEVVLENLPADYREVLTIPNDPRDPSKGDSQLILTPTLYIDRSDFRDTETVDSEYFRLAPGQPVGLFKAGTITLSRVERNTDGKIEKLVCTIDRSEEPAVRPKAFIQWVPSEGAIRSEIRLLSHLFKSPAPEDVEGGFLADINPDSMQIIKDALVDSRLKECVVEEKFQFQRVGYFCVDKESTPARPVFNLTVTIKEDPRKN